MNKKLLSKKSPDFTKLKTEITSYFQERMAEDCSTLEKPTVSVNITDNVCTVHLSKMYQGLGGLISFANMEWLSQKLGTKKISLENENYSSGCDTCDWGSEHSVDFVCREIKA